MDIYAAQRKMRAMRKEALARGYIGLLNIGNHQISCMIIKLESQKMDGTQAQPEAMMLPRADFKVVGTAIRPTLQGTIDGKIQSIKQVMPIITQVLRSAQKHAVQSIDHVIVSVSGGQVFSRLTPSNIILEEGRVTDEEIERLLAQCTVPDTYYDLHAQPLIYALDHHHGLIDPRGRTGRRLSVMTHNVKIEPAIVDDIIHCVEECGLKLAGLVQSAYAAALSTLTQDEKKLGAACIEIGASHTNICVFGDNHMFYADSLPKGGTYISQVLSSELRIPFKLAEKIKLKYGGLYARPQTDHDIEELRQYKHPVPTRNDIIGIINACMKDILDGVRESIQRGNFERLPYQQIVLTGGGSYMPGLLDLVEKYLQYNVRLGQPKVLKGMSEASRKANFASLAGLALNAFQPQDELWDWKAPPHIQFPYSMPYMWRWFRAHW